jgi:glycosyltransferase involved in cell wall biosynthesis
MQSSAPYSATIIFKFEDARSMASVKISVVMPSFNQANFVEETIKSIVGQKYDNLEFIVIDGGSTDGSPEIIKKYLPQISYFVSEPDAGHANALNKGFKKSTGEIMAWLNSDDMYTPWTFRTVADIFEQHPDIDWLVGAATIWNDRGTMLSIPPGYKSVHDYLEGKFEWIQQESVFWRRRLWESTGGYINENYKLSVDGELWSRFFRRGVLWNANCILSGYRLHGSNRAQQFQAQARSEMLAAIQAMRGSFTQQEMNALRPEYHFLQYDHGASTWAKYVTPRSSQGMAMTAAARRV